MKKVTAELLFRDYRVFVWLQLIDDGPSNWSESSIVSVLSSLWIFQTIDVWLVVGMGVFGFNIGF